MLEFIGLSLLHVYHSVFVLSLFIYCCLFIRLERRSKSLTHLVVPLGLVTYLYSCISHHPSIHWFWLVSSVYTASTSKYEFSRHYSYCGEQANMHTFGYVDLRVVVPVLIVRGGMTRLLKSLLAHRGRVFRCCNHTVAIRTYMACCCPCFGATAAKKREPDGQVRRYHLRQTDTTAEENSFRGVFGKVSVKSQSQKLNDKHIQVDAPDGHRIVHQGWVNKEGGGNAGIFSRKSWKRRWFILRQDGTLKYYTSDKQGAEMKGAIRVIGASIKNQSRKDKKKVGSALTFVLVQASPASPRPYIFYPDTDLDFAKWQGVLNQVVQFKPPSSKIEQARNSPSVCVAVELAPV